MKRKKRKNTGQPRTRPSVVRNVSLFFLSLGTLLVMSIVFSYITNKSNISLDPLQKAISNMGEPDEKEQSARKDKGKEPPGSQQVASAYDFTFYDLLGRKEDGSVSPSAEHYSVQLATFLDRGHAEEFAKAMKEKARLSLRIDKKGRLYHVRWGSFTSRENADRQCKRLSEKLDRECIVVRM